MAGEAKLQVVPAQIGVVETPDARLVPLQEARASVVTVGLQGPMGPAAPRFEFAQSTPSAMWNVNHNLGFRPNVEVLSVGGVQMLAEVIHLSVNQVQIFFDQATAGLVICS